MAERNASFAASYKFFYLSIVGLANTVLTFRRLARAGATDGGIYI
jgi:hypothetical protein